MTSKLLSASILAVAALTSVSSFAEDSANFFVDQPAVSTTTRAEVRAQLQQADQQGRGLRIANDYPASIVDAGATSHESRAQVKAELLASSPADRAVYN